MKRKPISLAPLTNRDFDDAYFDHLKEVEDEVQRIHTDGFGIPTIGVGTALAVRGVNGKFQLRKDLDARINLATNNQYQLTAPERQRLQDAVNALNAGNPAKAKKLIPPYNENERTRASLQQANNKFGFDIDENGMRAAARPDMDSARDAAWNGVAAAAKNAGWSSAEIDAYKKQFYASEEMVGLSSIKYNLGNSAKLPKTNRHIVNGDRAGAIYEIEIRTNKNKTRGHASRRVKEAKFFAKGLNAADNAAMARHITANRQEYNDYVNQFPGVTKDSATAGYLKPTAPTTAPASPPSGAAPDEETVGASLDGMDAGTPATPDDAPDTDTAGAPEPQSFTPEQHALKAALLEDDGPVADIMAKDPADWTEDKFRLAKRETARLRPGPDRTALDQMATAFLRDKYSDDPVKLDATGRMIEPQPIRPINEFPVDPAAPGGGSLRDEMTRIAAAVAGAAAADGTDPAVAALQDGLNILGVKTQNKGASNAKPVTPFPTLKVDGVPGPRTRRWLKAAATQLGAPKVEEGLALGRFAKVARDAIARRNRGDVGPAVRDIFAPLFRTPDKPRSASGAEEESAFQATVNDLGEKALGRAKFKPLLEDGWFGPKTETAFRAVLPAAGADRFTTRFGQNLGFLGLDKEGAFT